jgi:hypothetical protein
MTAKCNPDAHATTKPWPIKWRRAPLVR